MKKTVFFTLFLLPILLVAQNGFTVTMNLKGLGDHSVKVIYQKNGKNKVDTLKPLTPDQIIWKGELSEPQLVIMDVMDTSLYLRVGKAIMAPPQIRFLLNNAEILIEGESKELFAAKITSKNAEVINYERLRMKDLPFSAEIWTLTKEQNRKTRAEDTAGNYQIGVQIKALRKKNQDLRVQFVNENPKAFASILVLQTLTLILNPEELGDRFSKIDDIYKKSEAAISLNKRIEGNKKTAIGKPVVPFAQEGIDGNMVDIAALKGKVILIDFWGSWCVPCRLSHPAMKELYAKYKSRGLEIIGISNEWMSGKSIKDQQIVWKKAVKEDGINWLQVLFNPEIRDIVKEYDINGYPTKYLVDQNGNYILKIVGNSTEMHKMLEAKLEEILPNR
jgi:thiol-disulfide isomerase/thioredoxin